MAGLLPSWNNFNRNGITRPADVAQHWQEVCESHDMPINHKIWIDDPLSSSFPPSIAFKAAQLQDTSLAIIFLRRIREMLFIEKKNIIQEDYLSQAAFEVGLDTARLMRDLKGKAVERFKFDLKLTQDHGITMLPSIIITNKEGRQIKVEGFQPYERLVDQIRVLPKNVHLNFFSMSLIP
jgi:predicted DsbA family dithiol-disulfide isomerase